jgi:hypothetical protein
MLVVQGLVGSGGFRVGVLMDFVHGVINNNEYYIT